MDGGARATAAGIGRNVVGERGPPGEGGGRRVVPDLGLGLNRKSRVVGSDRGGR